MTFFDARAVEPDAGRAGAVPAGWYIVMGSKIEVGPPNNGEGLRANTQYTIADGPYKGRTVYHNFALKNPNSPKNEEIGSKQMSAFCHAVGILVVQHPDQLMNVPFRARLKLVPPQDGYEEKNEITAFKHISDLTAVDAPSKATAGPGQTGPGARPPAAAIPPPPAAQPQAWGAAPAAPMQQPPAQQVYTPPPAAAAPVQQQYAPPAAAAAPVQQQAPQPQAWEQPATAAPQPWQQPPAAQAPVQQQQAAAPVYAPAPEQQYAPVQQAAPVEQPAWAQQSAPVNDPNAAQASGAQAPAQTFAPQQVAAAVQAGESLPPWMQQQAAQ